MFKKYLSLCLAALLVFALALPALALVDTQPKYNTPAGYNDHDYQKVVAFLETEDENGAKNGEKISPVYEPDDPATWTDPDSYEEMTTFLDFDGEKMFTRAIWSDRDLVGELDLSDCVHLQWLICDFNRITALNVTGCPELTALRCQFNEIAELDVTASPELEELSCGDNELTELDISANLCLHTLSCGNNHIAELDFTENYAPFSIVCGGNELTELDLSSCINLQQFYCDDNPLSSLVLPNTDQLISFSCRNTLLTELDLSCVPGLHFERITAEGSGTIGMYTTVNVVPNLTYRHFAVAAPCEGEEFLGWFNDDGELISSDLTLGETETSALRLTARFTGNAAVPGDMNGDGEVDISDALSVLRAAMGLVEPAPGQIAACDMDGDGELTVADALQVMRAAMGLITLG